METVLVGVLESVRTVFILLCQLFATLQISIKLKVCCYCQ